MIETIPQTKQSLEVLFVDLDGTLISTDLLWESAIQSVKAEPLILLRFPGWLRRGRAEVKQQFAQAAKLNIRDLPYREEVLEFLAEQRAAGSRIVLATAANRALAQQIADELGLFDDVLASNGESNLRSEAKASAIQAYCQQNGYEEFAYIGDHRCDLPIWKSAAKVYVVNPHASLLQRLREFCEPAGLFSAKRSSLKAVVRSLRPQQWLKNLLLFVPLLLAHAFTDWTKVVACLVAFVVFSLCASAMYVLNDLFDAPADRTHPQKKHRPFAAGQLSVPFGLALSAGLLGTGITISVLTLPVTFTALFLLYMVMATLYSWWLKRKPLVDVLVLAGLYTLRVLAGGAVAAVVVSEWLLAFSIFLFTSLAFAKRYAELLRITEEGQATVHGRGYRPGDINIIQSMGPCCGVMAVLVFALYINSMTVHSLYAHPQLLWLNCPLILYWIGRVWFLANRKCLNEDPVVFALRDRTSILVGATAIVLVVSAGLPQIPFLSK